MDTGIVRGELHLTKDRVLVVNQDPVMWEADAWAMC